MRLPVDNLGDKICKQHRKTPPYSSVHFSTWPGIAPICGRVRSLPFPLLLPLTRLFIFLVIVLDCGPGNAVRPFFVLVILVPGAIERGAVDLLGMLRQVITHT